MQTARRWGVELTGSEDDQAVWVSMLAPPFDPFVEWIKDTRGDFLVLRSSAFDSASSTSQVNDVAIEQLGMLNVAIINNGAANPLTKGAIVEFLADGPPRKHIFIEVESATFHVRGGVVQVTAFDAEGNEVRSEPAPSVAQLWMRAASTTPDIGRVLRQLKGNPGWFELYNAYEILRTLPTARPRKGEIERFHQTANAVARHPLGKFKNHPRPMGLWEARSFITGWTSMTIKDTLERNAPGSPN